MNTHVNFGFVSEVDDYRQKNGLQGRYAILLLDNHSSRDTLVEQRLYDEHKIILLSLPAHSSALLQPLDLQPNGVFKQQYYKQHEPRDEETAGELRKRVLCDTLRALSVVLSMHVILTGWERTGLITGDPEQVLKSTMVQQPRVQANPTKKRKRAHPLSRS
jgi:hypothetical protein